MIVTRTHVIKIKHIFYQIVLNLLDVNAEFLRKPLHNFWDMSFKTQAPINSKHYQLWNAAALSETSLLLFTLSPWYRFKMCFTKEDRILIKLLRQDKKSTARDNIWKNLLQNSGVGQHRLDFCCLPEQHSQRETSWMTVSLKSGVAFYSASLTKL